MKKKILGIVTIAAMMMAIPSAAFAANTQVNINCVYDGTTIEGSDTTADAVDNEDGSYTVTAPEIDGYLIQEGYETQDTTDLSETVTFQYDKSVGYTVKYVDADGTEIATSKDGVGAVGKAVSEDAIEIDGYTLTSDSTSGIDELSETADENVITFTYEVTDTEDEDATTTDEDEDEDEDEESSSDTPKTGDMGLMLYGLLGAGSLVGMKKFRRK